jgi:hypothetical protein
MKRSAIATTLALAAGLGLALILVAGLRGAQAAPSPEPPALGPSRLTHPLGLDLAIQTLGDDTFRVWRSEGSTGRPLGRTGRPAGTTRSSTRPQRTEILLAPAACQQTITVTSTADGGPGSLRQAILDLCDGGTVVVSPTVATISLTSIGNTITDAFGFTALPAITKAVTIRGNGVTIERNDTITARLFYVAPGASLALHDLTLRSGLARGGDGAGGGGGAAGMGGAVFNNRGTLALIASPSWTTSPKVAAAPPSLPSAVAVVSGATLSAPLAVAPLAALALVALVAVVAPSSVLVALAAAAAAASPAALVALAAAVAPSAALVALAAVEAPSAAAAAAVALAARSLTSRAPLG